MKINTTDFLHDSLVVLGRNVFSVLWYLFFTGLSVLFLVKVTVYAVFIWAVLFYNAIRLLISIFELVIDYLDTVLNIRRLSAYRQRCYERKIHRFRNSRIAGRKKAVVLMPYQSSSIPFTLPQAMLRNSACFQDD